MAREQGRARTFTRRSLLLLGGQLGLFGLLAGRLYWLQVVESEKYQTLSDTNRISLRLVPPVRGRRRRCSPTGAVGRHSAEREGDGP